MPKLNRLILGIQSFGFGMLLATTASAAEVKELSAQEFYAASYYKNAQEHPELQKLSDKAKLQKVAKDVGMKPKDLEKAVAKFESLGGDPSELAKQAIESKLDGTRVKGRIKSVMLNAEEAKHVVAYICWEGSASKNSLKEAATIAQVVGAETPLVSTLSLNAVQGGDCKAAKASVWSGKIGHEGMERINPGRIEDYAERLYKGLFEGITERPF